MRVSLILAIISITQVFAETASSQSINLNVQEMSVREVFREIEQQSHYSFFYNDSFFDLNKQVSLAESTGNIDEVMSTVLANTNLTYKILEDNLVVIAPNQPQDPRLRVTGVVTDALDGTSLPGVTIQVIGSTLGTVTDIDGRYDFNVPLDATLRFSFIGMEPIEIAVENRTVINIQLERATIGLGEVVVTGYSIQRRSTPTGALSRVEGDAFREALIQSPDQALQGRMSGVQVSHGSGQPGSGLYVRIRGLGSITASNAPLYIVDGVQVSTGYTSAIVPDNALSSINPNDIENIEVLKDASATAMYGAQGANGVVLITTRQAARGQTQFNVSSQFGFNEQPKKLDIMDGPTWTETMIQGYVNYYVDRGSDPDDRRQRAIDRYGDPATAPTYDWQEALTRAGALRTVNFSASAGLDNTRIFLSGAYDYEEGAVIASDFSSLRFRSNIDHSFSDRFTIATRLSVSSSQANGLVAGSANITSPFHGGYTQRPIDAIYNEDGSYNHNDFIRVNLVQQLNENIREAATRQMRGSATGVYRVSERLSFRTLFGVDYLTVRDRAYTSALLPRYADRGGSLTERFRESVAFNTNQLVEFQESYNQHSITLLGGFEYRQSDRQSFTGSAQQFPNPVFSQLDLAAEVTGVSGRTSHSKFAGFFSRADYDYDGKYYVTANVRYDGSSRFGSENQWGLFYSGAFAWDIAKESFMADVSFINELKLRTSYGITGNSGIGDFASRSLFGSGGTYEGNTGLRPSGLGNDLLTWEEAQTLDLGFEFSVLRDRLYGVINRFNTKNKNLLLNAWLPTDSGFSSITRNSGVVQNKGWEIELGARWITTDDFSWATTFNFTQQENEILELVDGLDILGSSVRVGYPLNIMWMNPVAGINPADGRVFWYDIDGELTYRRSSADLTVVGNYSPDYFGGLINLIRYKNFRLSTFFQYEYGRSTYNSTVGRRMQVVSSERGLMADVARLAWQQPGDMAQLPRHYISSSFPGSSSHNNSSVFVKDASYIRLKEIRLDYNLPRDLIQRIGLTNASVFVQGRNVLLWTNYPYGDPEFVGQGTGEYPQSRQIATGVNIQF